MAEGQTRPMGWPVWILAVALSVGASGYFAYHTGAAIAGGQRSDALVGIGALVLIGAVLGAIRMGGIGSWDRGSGADGSHGNAGGQGDRREGGGEHE